MMRHIVSISNIYFFEKASLSLNDFYNLTQIIEMSQAFLKNSFDFSSALSAGISFRIHCPLLYILLAAGLASIHICFLLCLFGLQRRAESWRSDFLKQVSEVFVSVLVPFSLKMKMIMAQLVFDDAYQLALPVFEKIFAV